MNRYRLCFAAFVLSALSLSMGPVHAQDPGAVPEEMRFKAEGLPDIVLPSMNPARGRVYFATRGCVVCHSVNGIGGAEAGALDMDDGAGVLAPLDFASRMWRGGSSMLALQESLFGEPVDLTAQEIGDIMAFLNDDAEKRRFTEGEIPGYIRDFMAGRAGAREIRDSPPRK